MAGQQDRSFLESFGRVIGQLPMGIKSPLMEKTIELQLAKDKRILDEQLARQQLAFDQVVKLERQKDLAADWQREYGNKPEADNLHGPIPEFGKADQLRLYQQYGQAGLDPEQVANAEQAELAADAFRRGLANITNDAALVNIGMGKEYKPVELEGGVFYNPYDTTNFNLGSTQKHRTETQLVQSEAAEKALRLANIQALKDPLMQINATANKELSQPIESEVEGPDGTTHKALITQDSNGNYRYATVTDDLGKPLVIPPEAVGGGDGLTTDQKNVRFYSTLWGKPEAETAVILKSKSLFSDAGFLEDRLVKNAQGPYGMRNSDKEIFTATFDDFKRARYGSEFPTHFRTEIERSRTMKDAEKTQLIADIDNYNQEVFEMQLAGQGASVVVSPTTQTTVTPPVTSAPVQPVVTPAAQPVTSAQVQPVMTPAAQPVTSAPVQPQLTMPVSSTAPAPDFMPETQPAAPPVPIPEFPPAPDFMAFAETVMTNDSPAQINAALKKQGFDLSSQAMNAMAIDAINQGVSLQDIQQLYQLLGITWQPQV